MCIAGMDIIFDNISTTVKNENLTTWMVPDGGTR